MISPWSVSPGNDRRVFRTGRSQCGRLPLLAMFRARAYRGAGGPARPARRHRRFARVPTRIQWSAKRTCWPASTRRHVAVDAIAAWLNGAGGAGDRAAAGVAGQADREIRGPVRRGRCVGIVAGHATERTAALAKTPGLEDSDRLESGQKRIVGSDLVGPIPGRMTMAGAAQHQQTLGRVTVRPEGEPVGEFGAGCPFASGRDRHTGFSRSDRGMPAFQAGASPRQDQRQHRTMGLLELAAVTDGQRALGQMHGPAVEVLIAQTERHGNLNDDPAVLTQEIDQVRQRGLGVDPSREADPRLIGEERRGVDLAEGPAKKPSRRWRGPGRSPTDRVEDVGELGRAR